MSQITFGDPRLPSRFWSKTDAPDGVAGCWEWQAYRLPAGYGNYYHNGRRRLAHRVAYTELREPIPSGLHIDHLCRNTRCVNPAHLEAVTQAENTRRGTAPPAKARRSGICKHGHSLADAIVRKTGHLQCRTCHYERHAAWQRSDAGRAYLKAYRKQRYDAGLSTH